MGSASAVFPFPVNSSLPRGIEDASSGCCKSFLRSRSGAESLHKMACRPAQYLHVAHCLLCLLASELCFPRVVKSIFH